MCCSVSPGVRVRFSNTVLYGAEVQVRQQTVHVLGYQNKVQNRAGEAGALTAMWSWLPALGATGNAMILPFPAMPGTMTAANVIDTARCRDILQDMADAVAPPPPRFVAAAGARGRSFGGAPSVQVFKAAGIYTVVLARDARDIPEALAQVPRSKRPALNPALFEAYARWYPDWTVALCCFDNRRARLANPMLWWYEPMWPQQLFLPALDCHTGDVPDLDAQVPVDHVIAVGSYRRRRPGREVYYGDEIPAAVAPYLVNEVIGADYRQRTMPNGDFVADWADVRDAEFVEPARRRPAAA